MDKNSIEIVGVFYDSDDDERPSDFGFSNDDGFLIEFNGYIGFDSWSSFVLHFNKDNHGYDLKLFEELYKNSKFFKIEKINFKLLETDSPTSIETMNKINLIIEKINDIVDKINAI